MTIADRMALTPSVEIGIRQDGGDAETGSGMDLGAGLALADGVTGLAVDIRVRRLLVHEAEGFAESGMSISVSYNPTPKSTPLGFTARVSPAWGGDAMSGADALWGRETMGGMGQDRTATVAAATASTPRSAMAYRSVLGSSGHPAWACAPRSSGGTTGSATASRYSSRATRTCSSGSMLSGA